MAEWLERALAVGEVSGSIPSRCKHKNLCGRRGPTDYMNFRRAVKRQRFHTLETHDTTPRTTLYFLTKMTGSYFPIPVNSRKCICIYLFIYLFVRQLPKSYQSGVGAHQRQGKRKEGKKSEKSERKERVQGAEGGTLFPIAGN